MVAPHRAPSADRCPDSGLCEDLLAEVADLRARGRSWEEVAAEVQWDVHELRRALRNDRAYAVALRRAKREIDEEAEAEALQRLRVLVHDDNPKIARDASHILLRYVAQERRDRTRLRVERMRAAARGAKRGAGEPECAPEAEASAEPDELERRVQAIRADRWARGLVAVYLWGGCHRTDAPPDATDTPLVLYPADGEKAYWAVPAVPSAPDPLEGPFLAPPGLRLCADPLRESDAPAG